MATKIRIPKSAIPDLSAIRDIGPESLGRVYESLVSIEPLPLRRKILHERVAIALKGDANLAETLVRQLLAFYQLIKQRELESTEELLESLRDALNHIAPPWGEDEVGRWEAIEPVLGRLVICDAIRTVSKATLLEYDFANLFKSGRIITDIRPVFNDLSGDGLAIDGAVISHTLRLSYDNASGDHDLSLAMDVKDIHALKLQCDRAILKAQRAKSLVRDSVPTAICGEQSDE